MKKPGYKRMASFFFFQLNFFHQNIFKHCASFNCSPTFWEAGYFFLMLLSRKCSKVIENAIFFYTFGMFLWNQLFSSLLAVFLRTYTNFQRIDLLQIPSTLTSRPSRSCQSSCLPSASARKQSWPPQSFGPPGIN